MLALSKAPVQDCLAACSMNVGGGARGVSCLIEMIRGVAAAGAVKDVMGRRRVID